MCIRFAWTGLDAACLFRRSHEAETLWEGGLPSSVTPRPSPAGPDGIASCVGLSDGAGWLLQLRGRTGRNRELRGFSRTGSRAAWAVFPRKGDSRPARPRKGESRPATVEKSTQRRIPSGAPTQRRFPFGNGRESHAKAIPVWPSAPRGGRLLGSAVAPGPVDGIRLCVGFDWGQPI